MKIFQIGARGVVRYSEEVWKNTVKNRCGMKIDFMFVDAPPILGSALNLPIETFLRDFRGYDIIHNLSNYPFFPLNTGNAIKIGTAHEMQPILYPELTKTRLHSFKDVLWEIGVVQLGLKSMLSSDYIIANSKQSMEGVIKTGFPSDRVSVTPLGIDERYFRKKNIVSGRKGFKAGMLGTLGPQKNVFFAIDAFKKIQDKDIQLELWGKSIYSKKELSRRIGKDKRVRIMGMASEKRKVDIYDTFDIFLFPSIFEGFGIPIIEAKSRGIPVVILRDAHLTEEVSRYCFRARNEEHMADIIHDIKENGYNVKLKKKAIADARQYTWKRTGEATIEAYKKAEDIGSYK